MALRLIDGVVAFCRSDMPVARIGYRQLRTVPVLYDPIFFRSDGMAIGRTTLPHPVRMVTFVTTHALERWIERTGNKSKERALQTLAEHLEKAEEVELAVQYRATALLNHDLKPARYLRSGSWILVVSEDGGLVTIHRGTAKRWVRLGTKPAPKRRRPRPR